MCGQCMGGWAVTACSLVEAVASEHCYKCDCTCVLQPMTLVVCRGTRSGSNESRFSLPRSFLRNVCVNGECRMLFAQVWTHGRAAPLAKYKCASRTRRTPIYSSVQCTGHGRASVDGGMAFEFEPWRSAPVRARPRKINASSSQTRALWRCVRNAIMAGGVGCAVRLPQRQALLPPSSQPFTALARSVARPLLVRVRFLCGRWMTTRSPDVASVRKVCGCFRVQVLTSERRVHLKHRSLYEMKTRETTHVSMGNESAPSWSPAM